MENIKIKVCAYARFSSTNQRVESIETQLKTIQDYCDKNNLEIVATYTDEAKTATNDDRDGFLKMIEDSKEGKWEAIVLYSLDRFSRNAVNHYHYKDILDNYGVRIIAILDGIEGADSAETGLMENIKIGLAEYYSAHLSKVILDSCIMTSRNCLKVGGVDNLGFKTVDQKYYIDEDEANIVRLIFDMFLEHKSLTQICNYLNENGYKTKLGNDFVPSSLDWILHNRKYDGQMVYNVYKRKSKLTSRVNKHIRKPDSEHVIIKDALPRIIDHEKFEQVQLLLNKYDAYKIQFGQVPHLLTGLVFCSQCGGRYHHEKTRCGTKRTIRNIYRCSNSNKKGENKCKGKSINADYLDEYVLKIFDKVLLDKDAISNIMKVTKDRYRLLKRARTLELKKLNDQLKELDTEIDKLSIISSQSSGIAKESLIRAVNQRSIERSQLVEKITKIEDDSTVNKKIEFVDIQKIIKEYYEARKSDDILELRRVILMILKGIYMGDNRIEFVLDLRNFTKNISGELIDRKVVERSVISKRKFNFSRELEEDYE